MHADAKARGLQLLDLRQRDRAVNEKGRARDYPVAMGLQDAAAHAGREAEIVGIDDQDLGVGGRRPGSSRAGHRRLSPWTIRRSTVAGMPTAGSVASASRPRMWSRRS